MIYFVITGRVAVYVVSWILKFYSAIRGLAAADGAISAYERRYVNSGWPLYGYGWMNLHTSRFAAEVRRRLHRTAVAGAKRPLAARPPRIGCVGPFVGLLGFPKRVMQACPVPLVIADLRYSDRDAAYLRDCAVAYQAFEVDAAADIAAFLSAADVDLVLNIGHKPQSYDIVDRVDAPCIANYCPGSDLMHHAKVDIQYHGQPEADYFVVEGRMFCGTTAHRFGDARVHPIMGYIDPRGLALDTPRAWAQREALIVCHGSLFKFAHPELVDGLCNLLADDARLELVLMGKDTRHALQSIQRHAARRGVAAQVHYEGQFNSLRNEAGEVEGSGWQRLVGLLQRARLAPDPFPVGGGSSRFEAYALGTPSVHMGVRFDRDAWCRTQPGNCEIPFMLLRRATAWSVEEYEALCRRCLTEAGFADALGQDQAAIARQIADVRRFWREILDGYEHWRASAGRARAAA